MKLTKTFETKSGSIKLTFSKWEKHGKSRVYANSSYGKLAYDLKAGQFVNCHGEINNPEIRRMAKDFIEANYGNALVKDGDSILDWMEKTQETRD